MSKRKPSLELATSPRASFKHDQQMLLPDPGRHAIIGWLLVIVGFLGFILWAGLAPLDKGTPVSGEVIVSGNRKTVQHLNGGIIGAINISDGDHVQAGQVLLKLDNTSLSAELSSLQAQFIGALTTADRLAAERDRQKNIIFSSAVLSQQNQPSVASAILRQRQLFDSRQRALQLELDALEERIIGAQEQLNGLKASQHSKLIQLKNLQELLTNYRALAEEGYIPHNRLLETERLHAEMTGAVSEGRGQIGQLKSQIVESRLQKRQRLQEYQQDVRHQLADVLTQAEDLKHKITRAQFALDNTLIRAPADGVVVGLNVFTRGGIVSPGQALMDIVPAHEPLQVEGHIPVNLIDNVHPGLPVELIFSALNQATTPRIHGEVLTVSADRLINEQTGEPYYNVLARVSPEGMKQLAGLDVRPGMPVETFIRTGERSLLNYLFKPLLDRTHMALTEE